MARPTEIDRTFLAEAIRRLRFAFQETQHEFAARIGVSQVTLAKYETNRVPKLPILRRLSAMAEEQGLQWEAHVLRGYSVDKLLRPQTERSREMIARFIKHCAGSELRVIAAIGLLRFSPARRIKIIPMIDNLLYREEQAVEEAVGPFVGIEDRIESLPPDHPLLIAGKQIAVPMTARQKIGTQMSKRANRQRKA